MNFYQVCENTNYSIDVDTIFIKSKSKQSIVNAIFFDAKFLYITLPNSILYTKSSMPSELTNSILSMSYQHNITRLCEPIYLWHVFLYLLRFEFFFSIIFLLFLPFEDIMKMFMYLKHIFSKFLVYQIIYKNNRFYTWVILLSIHNNLIY